MRIKITDYPDKKQNKDIRKLVRAVNASDMTHYGDIEEADMYYLYYDDICRLAGVLAVYEMGDTYNGKNICELSAFVRADSREQGIFKHLLEEAYEDYPEHVYRFAVYENVLSENVLVHFDACHDHDELMLCIDTAGFEACSDNDESKELFLDMKEQKISSEACECYFRIAGKSAYVFGVLTFANYRRRGYAEKMLKVLFSLLRERGINSISLHVSSDNTAAVALYEKLGMKENDRLCYWYLEPKVIKREKTDR